jgi:hypothetical protein
MSLAKAYSGVKSTDPNRKANDYYPTAPVATFSLIEMEDRISEGFPTKVWEPAAGRGWMSQELQNNGVEVISTDLFGYEDPLLPIKTGVDFLTYSGYSLAPAIVTNPPYKNKLAERFLSKCLRMEEVEYFAFLVRLTFMESQGRLKLFQTNPPTRVYPFSKRFNCDDDYLAQGKQFGGMISYAWFVWDYRYGLTDKTNMHWIDTQEMFDRMKQR